MQVSVGTLNDLERRVTVQLPAEQVTREIQDRLVSMSRRLKVDGFRPGKVPLKVITVSYTHLVHAAAGSTDRRNPWSGTGSGSGAAVTRTDSPASASLLLIRPICSESTPIVIYGDFVHVADFQQPDPPEGRIPSH